MFCSQCGHKNDDDARFCFNCGALLYPAGEQQADDDFFDAPYDPQADSRMSGEGAYDLGWTTSFDDGRVGQAAYGARDFEQQAWANDGLGSVPGFDAASPHARSSSLAAVQSGAEGSWQAGDAQAWAYEGAVLGGEALGAAGGGYPSAEPPAQAYAVQGSAMPAPASPTSVAPGMAVPGYPAPGATVPRRSAAGYAVPVPAPDPATGQYGQQAYQGAYGNVDAVAPAGVPGQQVQQVPVSGPVVGSGSPVSRRSAKMSVAKGMVLMAIDILLTAAISYLPWVNLKWPVAATPFSLPRMALNTIDAIATVIRSSMDNKTMVVIGAGFVMASLWLISVYFLVRDVYNDVLSRRHVHIGYIMVIVTGIASVGVALFANASVPSGAMTVLELFDPASSGLFTMTIWPLSAMGAGLIALILDGVLS